MPKKIEEKLHILSPYRGYLASANVMGPIVHPLTVNKSIVAKILMSGADVYEYIPENKKTLKLTLANINDPNRYSALTEKVAEVTPVVVAPVTKIGVPNIVEPVVKVENAVTATIEATPEEPAVVEAEEVVVEETATEAEPEVQQPAFVIEFEYNEDGTIDETKIEWAKYSKNQRKEIRAQINQHNASLTN